MSKFIVYGIFIDGVEYYPSVYRSTSKAIARSNVEYLKKFSWNNDKNITIKKLEIEMESCK